MQNGHDSHPGSPTVTPPGERGLGKVLGRNIEAMARRAQQQEAAASFQDRIAQEVTRFCGSMLFVYVHLAALVTWVAWNTGLLGLTPWDSTFVILATAASVEAIFLSTFVLISQNRAASAEQKRAELDLQV